MSDKGVVFQKADKPFKKYKAILPNGTKVWEILDTNNIRIEPL